MEQLKSSQMNRLKTYIARGMALADYVSGSCFVRNRELFPPVIHTFNHAVLSDRHEYPDYRRAEAYRQKLRRNRSVITVHGFGAGTLAVRSKNRTIRSLAMQASVSKKFGRLLYRMVRFYQPVRVIEMGTSLGISTHYLALGNAASRITTIEADTALASVASEGFTRCQLTNTGLINGLFDNYLPSLEGKLDAMTMVFIDGDHSYESTLKWVRFFLAEISAGSIIVLDDINWSAGMRQAWKEIRQMAQNCHTIDLFRMGIVFKQEEGPAGHYMIRF
jgi:predicted O-methyltransferase YrrM